MQISVAGGFYHERCVWPDVNEAYGSGGRAAIAIAQADVNVNWHYYCAEEDKGNAEIILNNPRLNHFPSHTDQSILFRYVHPLSKPNITPSKIKKSKDIVVDDDVVLRFGFMEGSAKINAKRCIYDPQSHDDPTPFSQNGSQADEVALVLNAHEVLNFGETNEEKQAIENLQDRDGIMIVLVKAGAEGCRVYNNGVNTRTIPPFWVDNIYKIGSGDVFSAAFAYHWGLNNIEVALAAELASKCVAHYCNSRTPNVLNNHTQNLSPVVRNKPGQVYIAGPFFTMAELWLIEEAFSSLRELGVKPFSPYHEVGIGTADQVVAKDIEGLEASSAVFAVLDGCDPGTVFEIGYATKMGIPVVALSQNPKKSDLTMLEGSENCHIVSDFATAMYKVAWLAQL